MIPSLSDVLEAHAWLTRRLSLSGFINASAVAAALDEAQELAPALGDAAALFYALSRRPKAMRDAWAPLVDTLAVNAAAFEGLRLDAAGRAELRTLRTAIAGGNSSPEQVRAWFDARKTSP